MEQFDLIIIGAGISGLSVLEEIKDTGLRVGVIERSQNYRRKCLKSIM